MTEEQQQPVHLPKVSAQRHLSNILSNPDGYLGTIRYEWTLYGVSSDPFSTRPSSSLIAKCAFSVLLLLKLARLVPSSTNMPDLIADAKTLLSYFSKARGSSIIYFRILGLTVERARGH